MAPGGVGCPTPCKLNEHAMGIRKQPLAGWVWAVCTPPEGGGGGHGSTSLGQKVFQQFLANGESVTPGRAVQESCKPCELVGGLRTPLGTDF